MKNEVIETKNSKQVQTYLIYTDGSCVFSKTKNHKLNSWAFVVVEPLSQKVVFEKSGVLEVSVKSLSNKMELVAMEKALEWLPKQAVAIIYSDSANALDYTRKAIYQEDRNDIDDLTENYEHIKKMMQDSCKRHIHLKKVKSHKNNYWNNYVDYLCDVAIAEQVIGSLKELFSGQSSFVGFKPYEAKPELNLPQIEKLHELKELKESGQEYIMPKRLIGVKRETLKSKGIDLYHYSGFEREELIHFALQHEVKLKETQKGQITVTGKSSFDYQIDHPEQHIYHKSFGKVKYVEPKKAIELALQADLNCVSEQVNKLKI